MKKSDFVFDLPKELIAQYPRDRGQSRLFVLYRKRGKFEHKSFKDIMEYVKKDDCLVINNSKVIPARFYGYRESSSGKLELLLIEKMDGNKWKVLISPGRKGRVGDFLVLENKLRCRVLEIDEKTGERIVEFEDDKNLLEFGSVPLPPYIKRRPKREDKNRYQTIYAEKDGSVAAPTAGLHFDEETLKQFKGKGVDIAKVTLHVGPGTFRPVRVEDIEKHEMESERYEISQEAAESINRSIARGGDIFAVGTTTVRVLETVADKEGRVREKKGRTDLFIYPPYKFKVVNHLITNFHLPGSTLIMLVSAFADKEIILKAYRLAITRRYNFYSYGDAMLIL
ncbi:tRNA preQ1(34) S-adenosylmethionine ribosyltransferase-isomerase QueA [candidate division WOR-3 bacterium]|nr:tRNA preQ1(34) S-adenosylmethionine ribosyltransferase-isomerase QueA [candidate division WOR-3 bacterium]